MHVGRMDKDIDVHNDAGDGCLKILDIPGI